MHKKTKSPPVGVDYGMPWGVEMEGEEERDRDKHASHTKHAAISVHQGRVRKHTLWCAKSCCQKQLWTNGLPH